MCLSKAEDEKRKLEMEADKPLKEKISKAKAPEGQNCTTEQMGQK